MSKTPHNDVFCIKCGLPDPPDGEFNMFPLYGCEEGPDVIAAWVHMQCLRRHNASVQRFELECLKDFLRREGHMP